MYPIIPNQPYLPHPPPPVAEQIEQLTEPRYWVELRDTLGELSVRSQLFPDAPIPDPS